jgi:hypothetical protein
MAAKYSKYTKLTKKVIFCMWYNLPIGGAMESNKENVWFFIKDSQQQGAVCQQLLFDF